MNSADKKHARAEATLSKYPSLPLRAEQESGTAGEEEDTAEVQKGTVQRSVSAAPGVHHRRQSTLASTHSTPAQRRGLPAEDSHAEEEKLKRKLKHNALRRRHVELGETITRERQTYLKSYVDGLTFSIFMCSI